MKKLYIILNVFLTLSITPAYVYAQCPTDLLNGQNLVKNPEFTNGYTDWTFTPDADGNVSTGPDGYVIFNPPVTQNFSAPGFIYAATTPNTFNNAFPNFNDHSASADNMMLMVDGVCSPNIKLWQQANIPVSPGTNYYFSVWTHTLKDFAPGDVLATLRFDVNGTDLGAISAPRLLADGWVKYEITWNSGATSGPVTISIENTTLTDCNTKIDFAIDDISFIPGCSYGAPGPQPNLGPDQTLCGKGGSIIIDSNVPHNATTTVTWSSNAPGVNSGTGLSAPYTKTITAPGTYSVCVTDNGSCTKSDVIVITNTYTIDLGPDVTLCSPSSATFNAGFTGPGVTYQWYKSYPTLAPGANTGQTYFVNTPGTYRVDVTDPVCGLRSDVVVVTSNAAIPVNGTYCSSPFTAGLSVTGSGTYRWYDTPTKGTGTLLGSGNSFTTPALTPPASATYYVEDISSTAGSVGRTVINTTGLTDWGTNPGGLQMKVHIYQDVQIMSVKVPLSNINVTSGTITIEVRDASGNSFSPAKTFQSLPTTMSSANNNTLVQFNFAALNLSTTWGNDLRLTIFAKDNFGVLWNQGGGPHAYPYASTPTGIIDLTGGGGSNATNNDYPFFYDVRFQTGVPCERVPVTATYSCPMPVGWNRFTATSTSDAVQLNWSTAFEENNKFFMVERSEDGVHFEVIKIMPGSGNKNGLSTYSYTDNAPLPTTAYYRIGQQDYDGKTSYTSTESISRGIDIISVYPNPFENGTTLMFISAEQTDYTYIIYSISGQIVETGTGTSGVAITVAESLANGMYMLSIRTDVKTETVKIIKK